MNSRRNFDLARIPPALMEASASPEGRSLRAVTRLKGEPRQFLEQLSFGIVQLLGHSILSHT
jgi:hypothetical protein